MGGFFGTSLRYVLSGWAMRIYGGSLPFGTLIVNILGSFLIGLVMEAGLSSWNLSPDARIMITTGFLGGLTTFSTFSYETMAYIQDGSVIYAALNIFLNILCCLIFVWIGKSAGTFI